MAKVARRLLDYKRVIMMVIAARRLPDLKQVRPTAKATARLLSLQPALALTSRLHLLSRLPLPARPIDPRPLRRRKLLLAIVVVRLLPSPITQTTRSRTLKNLDQAERVQIIHDDTKTDQVTALKTSFTLNLTRLFYYTLKVELYINIPSIADSDLQA
jgi:hypothetical protein